MPRSPSKIKSKEEVGSALAIALRTRARNPNIEDYQPHDKQVKFHMSSAHGRQFIGGNRSGKTVGGGAEVVMYATGKHPYKKLRWEPPLRLRVVTVDFIQGLEKIVLPEVRRWLPQSELINHSWEDSWSEKSKTLTLANGSFIEFMSYEQDLEKFAGTSRHGVWFDEEPPKDIFTECKLRLVDTNGDWWMTMTPVEGMTWTFDDIYSQMGLDPNIYVVEVDMDDNPHLLDEAKEILLTGLTHEEIEARKHGKYISLGGLIYPEFNYDIHVIEPFIPPLDWLWMASLDHGLRNPTAWLWEAIDRDGRMVVFDEHYHSDMLIHEHAAAVHEKNKQHSLYKSPAYYVGDSSIQNRDPITGTSVQIEYARGNIPIMLATKDLISSIDMVKTRLKLYHDRPKLYITKNCANTIWEMRRYRWAVWRDSKSRQDKNKKEEPQKKDDHAMDSLRYAIATRPEVDDGTVIPWTPQMGNEAVDPTKGLVDKEAVAVGKKQYDYNLGEDY
jgi:phage terminase large subunit-like protein